MSQAEAYSHFARITPPLTLNVSAICRLFVSLGLLFRTPIVCFQQLAASFPKTPGWGVSPRFSPPATRLPRSSRGHSPLATFFSPTPLFPITSLQPLHFHAIAHSFLQRRQAIPPSFSSFRTLLPLTDSFFRAPKFCKPSVPSVNSVVNPSPPDFSRSPLATRLPRSSRGPHVYPERSRGATSAMLPFFGGSRLADPR